MRGSFFGLNVSVSGLFAAQKNLDVVSHNISNSTTEGYSRQVAYQTAANAIPMRDGTGMYGTGSVIHSVNRMRDDFLDYKYWSEAQASGEWSVKDELFGEIEATFNEPALNSKTASGFSAVFNDFYSSLQELSKSPSDAGLREIVKERGVTLVKYFNSTATQFEKLQDDVNRRIKTKVMEVNSLATQITDLNKQIYTAEVGGNVANDLRDQRTLLVDKLSKLINIQANEVVVGKRPDGSDNVHFVVTVGGKTLVDHFNNTQLEVDQRDSSEKVNAEDIPNLYDIKWSDTKAKVNITSGELKGYIDVRDGNEGQNGSPEVKGIPYYMKKLNEFVRTFAMSFNEGYIRDTNGAITGTDGQKYANVEGHADGYTLDSTGTTPSGIRFFTITNPSDGKNLDSDSFITPATDAITDPNSKFNAISTAYSQLTAKNICISEDVLSSYKNISAAGASGQKENADVLNSIIDLRNNVNMFGTGSAEDFMKSLISNLGIDAQQAKVLTDNQENIVTQVDNERLSVSGVNLNEEMANMIKYQQCYNASARMISTMSQIYDTLINKLGVG